MVQCPKCSTKLDIDFGMITCPKCQSVVFVEFDGTAKVADQSQVTRSHAAEEIAVEEFQTSTPELDLPAPDLSAFDDAIADDVFAPAPPEAAQLVNPGDISQAREPSSGLFQSEPPETPLDSEVVPVSSEPVSPDDPLGVTSYANSEFSQGKDGPFLFNLVINGLDSKEIRESLREAMNDSRFGWDTNQLLGQIRAGKLLIKNVSPVKASILVNRLKRLPLSISWEQHAITTVEKF